MADDVAMPTASEPLANKSPSSDLPIHPPKPREEGELSSDDEYENTISSVPLPTATSVPPSGAMLTPPTKKFTKGIQAGKGVFRNDAAGSVVIQSGTSAQLTSRKGHDKNRIPLKSTTVGWRAPQGASDNLVINFSDDDSRSDSEEKEHRNGKSTETKSHVTGVVANGKPPTSSLARSNKLIQTAKNVNKVMPKKLSMNRTFLSSMTKIRGVNARESGPSAVNQGSRVRKFSVNNNLVSRDRGFDQGMGLNNNLQDLRQRIALRESELKLKSSRRTKESLTYRDDDAESLHRDGASKFGARYSDVIQGEPKEPDKKRMKVGGSFSTQQSALGPPDIPVAKSILSSKVPAMEKNSPQDTVNIDHSKKGTPVGPTQSSIENWKNAKHASGVSEHIHSGAKDGAGTNTNSIQFDERSKMVPYVTVNQETSPENITCNNLLKNLNTVDLNHTNENDGQEPGSFLNKSTSGKNLTRSSDRQEVISTDNKLEPSYNICQESLNNASLWNCFGNANVMGDGDLNIHSLVEMEEALDKDLEEAQEDRRRCEIEERNALKAYRKAQRDLLQANARCSVLYRKREEYSAKLRPFMMDNSSSLLSSRQNEQAGIRLDHTNNISENVNLLPMSSHQMHPDYNSSNPGARDSNIHTSYKHLSGQNMGSDPCIEPDASTSEPVPRLGNSDADGVCSPSTEPNNSADEEEDEEGNSFENESVQPNFVCHRSTDIGDKQKDIDKESNRNMSIDSSQDPVLLERMLRSKLFAKLGTKALSKKSSSCNDAELAVERGAENDVRSETTQAIKGSFHFSEVEKSQQSDHEGTNGQDKSTSEAPLEIQRELSVESLSVSSHSNSYSEDKFYFGGNILRTVFRHMTITCPKILIQQEAGSQQIPSLIHSEKIQFNSAVVEPLKETLGKLSGREAGSYSNGPAIDPFWPLCMYELRGKCNNDECPWQHVKDYSNTNVYQRRHDNSDSADCQVGFTVNRKKCDDSTKVPWYHSVMTSPTYLVGSGILKADLHSYESVLARRNGQCWKKCFSHFLLLSNLFRKDISAEGPLLHGNKSPVSWNRQSSDFQSGNGGVSRLTQALADNDQYLEMVLLIFSQEANELEGMRKALPVMSRALEADPTSTILWIFYLLIYYSNMKSVGNDDMYSCAVKYNERSYELWLMFINSRMQLDDRLVTYDVALSALCRHAPASDIDGMHYSGCILDLCLQMMDCLRMSGNTEKAIQKIFGLFPTATNFDVPNSVSLSDILACLTVYDKCVLGVCCVYLVIYRKLPDGVVRQCECQKELFEIEWHSIQLVDDEKRRAIMLMETVVNSVDSYMKTEPFEKSEFDLRLAHFCALNHVRCMAALDTLESVRNTMDKYLTLYPSCLELVLISARSHKLGDSHFDRFEEALSNWPKETPGIQCIWNQYVEYTLQNGRYDIGKEVMDRWFHSFREVYNLQNGTSDEMKCDNSDDLLGFASDSSQKTLNSDSKEMDAMFGYLNLSLLKLLQNDRIEARLALDKALNAAVPEYVRHCIREHALSMLTDESAVKETACISGIQKILERYLGAAQAFPISEPLSRKFINNIKKPRVRRLASNAFCALSSDFSVVNSALEVWYGPSLLPECVSEQYLVDFVEAILDITPSNYQLAISVCKMLRKGSNGSDVTSLSALFWASTNLVSAIFNAVPVPPENVWFEAAEILGNISGVEVVSERFYKRALSVYPFSVRLWKSYHILSMRTTGSANTVVEAAKEKGIELS